ncbi:hypothetical protein C8J57DRAFT_1070527, partial [Mycena rebaudengoi]
YNICECRRHGEAASVDLKAVEAEHLRVKNMARCAPEDRWSADETSFFSYAPPDRTLCSGSVTGEKQDRSTEANMKHDN